MTHGGVVRTMSYMAGRPRTLLQVRCDKCPDLPKRFKVAAAVAAMPAHEFLTFLLDQEESRQRRRAAQMASPLHRPPPLLDDYAEHAP